MLEKLKDLIKRVFSTKGIDESTTEEVLVELDKEEAPAEPQEPDLPLEEEPAPLPEESQEEPEPVEGEALPVEAEPVEAEQPAVEEPQPEPEVAPQPDFQQYDDKIAELQKTNEALLARIGSLEEALKASGIIEGSKPTSFGVDAPSAPAKDATDDGLEAFLARVNKKHI